MYCTNCGLKIIENVNYCSNCGCSIKQSIHNKNVETNQNDSIISSDIESHSNDNLKPKLITIANRNTSNFKSTQGNAEKLKPKMLIKKILILFLILLFISGSIFVYVNREDYLPISLENKTDLNQNELEIKEKELNSGNYNNQNVEPSASQSQTTSNENSLSYLKDYNNKYPLEVQIFELDPLKSRLQKLLGSKFTLFTKNINTQSPISVDRQYFFTSGCYPHSCGSDESAIGIDIKKDVIFVGILSSSKLQTYTEDSKATIPAKFNEWVSNFNPTPSADHNSASKYTSFGTINSLEFQGNNYLSITILTSNSSNVLVWCIGGETTVYKDNLQTYWSVLKKGMKIGVTGKWKEGEDGKEIGAERIDIL